VILGAAGLAAILYVSLWVAEENSDGYTFLVAAIRHSTELQARLGQIDSVDFSRFGKLRLRAVDSARWVTMTFHVTGAKGKVTVEASAERTRAGDWSVTNCLVDGNPIIVKYSLPPGK
jgi:hypothetical protein